jgi:hypothetical protein
MTLYSTVVKQAVVRSARLKRQPFKLIAESPLTKSRGR